MDTKTAPASRISSFAAPSREDMERFHALDDAEKSALLDRALEAGRMSGESGRSMDDLWNEALRRTGNIADNTRSR